MSSPIVSLQHVEHSHVVVSRHVSQEARVVLTSLRGGPPHVARGDLAQDLMDLRKRIEREIAETVSPITKLSMEENPPTSQQSSFYDKTMRESSNSSIQMNSTENIQDSLEASPNPPSAEEMDSDVPAPLQNVPHASPPEKYLNPYARPFLHVIMDPRAAGPHTLVTLRAIHRLIDQGSFHYYGVASEELTQSILACKFEQTDAGADEAVEMAIADVLRLLVKQDFETLCSDMRPRRFLNSSTGSACPNYVHFALDSPMSSYTLMDAFNTVFVTRKTFIHSPALCYHFEDVLTSMVENVFRNHQNSQLHFEASRLILQFLVNQLLHTPLVGGDGLDDSTRETQMTHNDTRTLCLRLTRCAIRIGWNNPNEVENIPVERQNVAEGNVAQTGFNSTNSAQEGRDIENSHAKISFGTEDENRSLLQIIQDDLCLSLLMTGQAIWAYHDTASNVSPGFVSLEVLSEICATFSILWTTVSLRSHLISQFETILTGFYTRALVLLRKRKQPVNSVSFNANLIFDAEVEIILESLVDILCLHDQGKTIADGDGGSLETMFAYYDCCLRRWDVACGIMVELCRCCGGCVNEEGEAVLTSSRSSLSIDQLMDGESLGGENESSMTNSGNNLISAVSVDIPKRQVPAHLKELCAQATMGGMKCLFRDDNPSQETLLARLKRRKSILQRKTESTSSLDEGDIEGHVITGHHVLRDLKCRKRLTRKAARIFNKHASRGIEFLLDSGLIKDPVTPMAVAKFLRNGIVVGLDKKQIGMYLGEAGKSPVAGKSPPSWERDWFHKDVLKTYCSLFRFENQSLLDGLRMFLATFRLPGEAQQIDRILQAFADSCGQVCEESSSSRLRLFSDDPKRASDAAYLLSFSIIMLNTDRHNTNIREDRKMSCDDFIKNNSDYGRDITEKGKEFPPEYLAGIYESINEEEIRTEGEGAEGAMTVERWKDVLRGSTEVEEENYNPHSSRDAEDLTELVVEHVWKPIMSAIGSLWGATINSPKQNLDMHGNRVFGESSHSGMLGVQGARLGMDLALEMSSGVRKLGRIDIFRKIFSWICEYTGLLGEYNTDCVERTWTFANSLESQSALVVVIRTSLEAGEDFDEDCWKRIWSIIFELRDLKLISKGRTNLIPSLLTESESDFLKSSARIDWNMCLVKGDMNYEARASQELNKGRKVASVFGVFGRALFGSVETDDKKNEQDPENEEFVETSVHGKEKLVIWNESGSSDDEDDLDDELKYDQSVFLGLNSAGDLFESRLIQENIAMSRQMDMPVTGLERVEETRRHQMSPRSRTRDRIRNCVNLSAFITDSRFLDEASFFFLVRSLVSLVSLAVSRPKGNEIQLSLAPEGRETRSMSVDSTSTSSFIPSTFWNVPLSPASEAFAEVLLCELALKNKDRLKKMWTDILQDHYLSKLTSILVNPGDAFTGKKFPVDPGLEKRITGLLRLSINALQQGEFANDVLSSWKYLLPMNDEQHASSPLRALDRHIGEGLLKIVSHVDCLSNLNDNGWEGLLSIFCWCAKRGGALKPVHVSSASTLAEDDPALQCYRSLHLLLNTQDIEKQIPCSIVTSIRSLVAAGGRRKYPQLSVACLDLMSVLLEKKIKHLHVPTFWGTCWRKIIEGIAEAAELSTDSNVRQHALSVLTDMFLKKETSLVPLSPLCSTLKEICIPLAGRRIIRLQLRDPSITNSDELMMEFELCIGLIFKPLRHHLKEIVGSEGELFSVWKTVLMVLENLFHLGNGDDSYEERREFIPDKLKDTMVRHVHEHLRNAVIVIMSTDVRTLSGAEDIVSLTWNAALRMGVSEQAVDEWKKLASNGSIGMHEQESLGSANLIGT